MTPCFHCWGKLDWGKECNPKPETHAHTQQTPQWNYNNNNKTVLSKGGMFRENSIEICILSRVKQITSPGWMHETSAQAWCTGKTQRNRVEREVGGGSGWVIHVNPWLIHVNVWQKPLQYCKVISLQLIKITGKKRKRKLLITKCTASIRHYYKKQNQKTVLSRTLGFKLQKSTQAILCKIT